MKEEPTEDCSENTLDEENNELDSHNNNTDMDELTLALLMNKNHYPNHNVLRYFLYFYVWYF